MWSLKADEKTCEPDPSLFAIECYPDSLKFSIDRQIFGQNQDNITLSFENSEDKKCLSNYQDGVLTLQTRFDECGTTAKHTEAGINFNNKVEVHSVQTSDG